MPSGCEGSKKRFLPSVEMTSIPNLAYFAPLREESPMPRVFSFRETCARRANFRLSRCKWPLPVSGLCDRAIDRCGVTISLAR